MVEFKRKLTRNQSEVKMRLLIVFLLCATIVGVFGIMSPVVSPGGPIRNDKVLYQAELDDLVEEYAEHHDYPQFLDDTSRGRAQVGPL